MTDQLTEVREVEQDIARWMRELKSAGWKEHYIGMWLHPDGKRYFRGPYLAWQVMQAERKSHD